LKSVVLIDDDPDYIANLSKLVKSCIEFSVVAETRSGREGILAIEHFRPDLIIMDIIMPDNDGLAVLKYIRKRCGEYNPYIYVITAMETPVIHAILEDYKVDFISFKPIDAEKEVTGILKNIHMLEPKKIKPINGYIPLPSYNPIDIIVSLLDDFKIPSHLMGNEYIKTILIFMLDDPSLKRKVYAKAAAIYNCTSRSVAANVNTAIKACMGSEMYRTEFGSAKAETLLFLHHLSSIAKKRMQGSTN